MTSWPLVRLRMFNFLLYQCREAGVRHVLTLLTLLLFASFAHAEYSSVIPSPIVSLDTESDYQQIELLYARDDSGKRSLDDIRKEETLDWHRAAEEYIDFGITPDVYWYRFTLENPRDYPISKIIEIDHPLLDWVDYYRFNEAGLAESVHTGDFAPYQQRVVDHPTFLFPLVLKAGEQQSIYLRVQTGGVHIVPLKVWQPEAQFKNANSRILFNGVFFGFCASVVMLYLLMSFWLRESMYLHYSLNIGCLTLYFASARGLLYPFVFSSTPEFHHLLGAMSIAASPVFGSLFARKFMALKENNKVLDNIALSVGILAFVCTFSIFFLETLSWFLFLMVTGLYVAVATIVVSSIAWYKGYPNAMAYTLAFISIMVFWIISVMSRFDIVPVTFITEFGPQIGASIEVLVLTVVLSYRVHREHLDKVAAQEAQLVESEERIKAETNLLHKSLTNSVTNLPNRSCFEEQLQNMILTHEHMRIAVVVIEVTRYAEICKTLGHQNTDMLLQEFSQRYNDQLAELPGMLGIEGPSSTAYASSLESPSFGVMMDADVVEGNMETIKRFVDLIRKPIEFKGMQLELDVVAGVAVSPTHGLDAMTLIRHAGVAVDSVDARERGIAYFRPEQDQYNTRRLTMITELKQAINQDDLELFLQPKYDSVEAKVVGAEALIRWQHKLYGNIRPDEFIPMAENTGIIKELTRWVFQRALAQQKALREIGYDLNISINVSAANLCEDDLVSFMASAIEAHGAEPQMIYIELTETAMMNNPERAIAKLEELCELGLKISIDDFGAGYSSLAYLKTLPASEIKIDRALVNGLEVGEGEDTVVQSTIDMCHKLGFKVVAEGVETAETLNELNSLHCDLIQGYLLTPPLPQDQFINWLERHHSDRFAS